MYINEGFKNMKKLGFTLSEIILAMGIVGIVAALAAPAIGDLMPDKRKANVVKAYKTASDITSALINDPGFYYGQRIDGVNCVALGCDSVPFAEGFTDVAQYRGSQKFPRLFLSQLELMPTDDGSDPITLDEATGFWKAQAADGIYWYVGETEEVKVAPDAEDGAKDYYVATAEFWIDSEEVGANEAQHSAFSLDNQRPTKFEFQVNENGQVVGKDELTKAFIANLGKLTGTKADYKTAKANLSTQGDTSEKLKQ